MSDRQQELATLIAAEHAGYARLLETLQTEQSYLISGDARRLETSPKKSRRTRRTRYFGAPTRRPHARASLEFY